MVLAPRAAPLGHRAVCYASTLRLRHTAVPRMAPQCQDRALQAARNGRKKPNFSCKLCRDCGFVCLVSACGGDLRRA
eukprot:3841384-Rhodomonas_salina.1